MKSYYQCAMFSFMQNVTIFLGKLLSDVFVYLFSEIEKVLADNTQLI